VKRFLSSLPSSLPSCNFKTNLILHPNISILEILSNFGEGEEGKEGKEGKEVNDIIFCLFLHAKNEII
jgi:hypothetical protein